MINPFKYSDDNKRYNTFNYYLRHTYQSKVFKLALDAGFTCPNRDGTCGYGGCTYCSSAGSGEFAGDRNESIARQLQSQMTMMKHKWPNGQAMAYFQAYTNTYADLADLKALYDPLAHDDSLVAIAIATRADCLDKAKINYFNELSQTKDIWIELGLQTIHDETAHLINRGHDYQTFLDCINALSQTNIKTCVHIINGLPNETEEMMLKTAQAVGQLPIDAIKIHMLHLLKGSKLGDLYRTKPFAILERKAYIDLVIKQLTYLKPEMVIERLTGDPPKQLLIAPEWTLNKTTILNDIDKKMAALDIMQGTNYKEQI